MTTKRNKGFAAFDLVLPVAPHYRTDPQVLKDIEAMRTNAVSRWAKDEYGNSGLHKSTENSSKIADLARPKVEILRANSPTLKRLLAARIKLEKIANTLARNVSASRQSIRSTRETPYPTVHEKQSSTTSHSIYTLAAPPPLPAPAPAPPAKQIKPPTTLDTGPLDKITYEKVWSRNGNIKQKCSLEIWLPKPGVDNDISRETTPDIHSNEKKSPMIPLIKSRRSSIVKITTTTVTNIEPKALDDTASKKSETTVVPRVYHYGDYIMDLPDERPRSSKSVTTVKSDNTGSIRSVRRQQTRPHTRRQSVSTNHSEEILRFGTVEVPATGEDLSVNPKAITPNREIKAQPKSHNPTMITELMQKYSLIKKSHQELTQAKLQLEKPATSNSTKGDNSPRSRPPPVPESTSLVISDQPTVSVIKLFSDATSVRSMTDNNSNGKLLDRRATPSKPSQSEIYPQLRIFSLANQRQHRQSSASVPTAAILPNVSGKKPDEQYRILQRSKTLDVVLDIPTPVKGSTRAPAQPDNHQRILNRTVDQSPSRFSKRSALNYRSEQQKPPPPQNGTSLIHQSRQRFYNPSVLTSVPTNKVLVHFNHSNNGNTDRNYLVPE